MKKYSLLLIILLATTMQVIFAQNTDEVVLMTIDNKPVSKAEFIRIYNKNNTNNNVIDKKSLEEYLELFINFKLKVAEAESLGLDTAASFVNELAGYRQQLAKPYLVDKKVDEELMKEAYDRLKYDVKASHILIKIENVLDEKEDEAAYNKAIKLRKKILKGASFESIARKESDDPSAKSNGGSLGYFTGFQMVYPFESAAFNTPVGEISMPIKTRFGYHIIKVFDKRPTVGKVKVAHIMISVKQDAEKSTKSDARKRIDAVYNKLLEGEDFAKLAKDFSDDKGSASKGGELPEFGAGRMVPEFDKAAFSLKNTGDFSKVIETQYGFHIIKLIEKIGVDTYENMKKEIKSRIAKDSRSSESRQALIKELKAEYHFSENKNAVLNFYNYVTDSILVGTWDGESAKNYNKVLFTLAGIEHDTKEFTEILKKKKVKTINETVKHVIEQQYNKWVDKTIIKYEESRLEEKYPEFRYLMNEYHDGILLFELSDQMVWSKAVNDTIGLQEYYEKNKTKYMWDTRVDASIYTLIEDDKASKLSSISNTEANKKALPKIEKLIIKRSKKGYDKEVMQEKLNKIITKKKSNFVVGINDAIFSKNDNVLIDKVEWKKGLTVAKKEDDKTIILMINEIVKPEPKELSESRGLVTADYQNFLEDEWIKELKKKHVVNVNRKVFDSIK